MNRELEIFADSSQLAVRACERFVEKAKSAVSERGLFTVALSGGSTPKRLYELLADSSAVVPWNKTHLFWTDERQVPPEHNDSNFRMVKEALLSKIDIPNANIHRIKAELADPSVTANDYEQTLKSFFKLEADQSPRFDLILLGLGPDAHTASMFPDHPALFRSEKLMEAVWVEKLKSHRTTMTMRVINNSRSILFLISGAEKAEALRAVLDGPPDPIKYPAQAVNIEDGTLEFLVDKAAASGLRRS